MSVKRHIQKFFSSYIVVTVRFIGGGTRVPYENLELHIILDKVNNFNM
jgi:hypothetical protein